MTSDAADRADLTALLRGHRMGAYGLVCTCGKAGFADCGANGRPATNVSAAHRAHVADAVLAAGWRRAEGGAGLSEEWANALVDALVGAGIGALHADRLVTAMEPVLADWLAGHAAEVERLTALWVNAEANQVEETERATAAETALADAAAELEDLLNAEIDDHEFRRRAVGLRDRAAAMREAKP